MAVLPDPGRSRAVLIGASTYRHLEDLPAVQNNLSGFRDVLVDPMLGGLPADNCTVLAEPAGPVDVYRALRQQAAAAEDTLLVYFAGHGRTGSRNELWLCLPGTDPDELPYSAWPYDELRRVVADSRATKKVVILDCCFSGRAIADQAGDEETILGQVGIEGTYTLTATPANAVALAPPGERYTAFTSALLGLLNKGIPDGPELLTFAQIYPHLQYTLTSRQLPRPRQQGSDTIAHLALTRNLAYTRQGGTRPTTRADDWAICCSGGGIRTAAYCLGALQSLDQTGLLAKAKWILGVSGGSYIAASRALAAHNLPPGTEPPAYAPGTPEEHNLRTNTRYIAPGDAAGLRGFSWLLLSAMATFILVSAPLYALTHAWGWLLRWQGALVLSGPHMLTAPARGPALVAAVGNRWRNLPHPAHLLDAGTG